MKKLLILAPHTDDAELGCGGTMARLKEDGVQLYVAAFSTAEQSLPPGVAPGTLKNEFLAAMAIMGIPRENLHVFDYPVRKLSYSRQEVLETLCALRRSISPDTVFVPSGADLHQDHEVLHEEGLRAFKDITIWGYELPWNHISFRAQAFVVLNRCHIALKWRALCEYHSQLQLSRPYFSEEFVFSLAKVRGTQIKTDLAEAFEVIRVRY